METFEQVFAFFERIAICLSPIIVGYFSLVASRNEKNTKKFIESQAKLQAAEKKIADQEKEELDAKFKTITDAVATISDKVGKIETKLEHLANMKVQVDNLMELSNANFEFCTSLSMVIKSIGNALDASEVISSEGIKEALNVHTSREYKLISDVCKIQ